MGGGLRKASSAYVEKGNYPPSAPSKSPVVAPGLTDEQLDAEEELQAKREEELVLKQKTAVNHVVENLFPYAPVTVQTQKYPSTSSKAGQAYLWISVDEDAIKKRGGAASPIRYPIGVAVDADGNVFVSEATSPTGASHSETHTHRISVESIMNLAANQQVPPAPTAPTLVEATQTILTVKWRKSLDTTVDRYEIQYRSADSPNNVWAVLGVVSSVKNLSLENITCHTCYEFRARAHNPVGWSEYSLPSAIFWSLPGIPAVPLPPIAGAVSNTFVSIFWSRVHDHGAPPVIYFLEMRECNHAQQTSFQQIYEGSENGFVAGGLQPKTTYAFRLQASNVIGSTVFVESRPIKTLAHGKPEIVELTNAEKSAAYDRWVQCWDPKSEVVFYFNKYTCQRVTEEPKELAEAREKSGAVNVEETPEMIFRRKRFRFHRDLRQSMQGVSFGNTMGITLRRDTMFEDTVAYFQRLSKEQLATKPKITFENEAGIDSGGLTKDWFLQISKLAASDKRGLFKTCDQGLLEINPKSCQLSNNAQLFNFMGKFIAKAIFDRQTLDLPLCDTLYKHILQLQTNMDDLYQMDAQFHKSLSWMLENDIAGIIDETFSVEVEGAAKKLTVVDLKENGRDIPVTDINKKEYVELIVQWRTEFGVKPQLDALLQGFSTLIPLPSLNIFEIDEVKMLVNGKPTIDVEELRACTVFQGGYSEHSEVVLWLWQALREFTQELRGVFLKFMTGSNKVPLDGFEPPLNITKSDLDPQALPRTHTCFNQLVLPEYTSYVTLVEKITFAIKNAEGFELS